MSSRARTILGFVFGVVSLGFSQAEPDISALLAKATGGDAKAQLVLGEAYEEGNGVPQDYESAVKWYRAAAEQGVAAAQNDLGLMYRYGHGVEKDLAQAMKWYRKAAKQGDSRAMFNLATMYYNGDGVPVNDVSAYAWFVLAQNGGSKLANDGVQRLTADLPSGRLIDAKLYLADMLLRGEEVPPDPTTALSVYNQVAPQADKRVQVRLAKAYINGPGVPRDYAKAEQYCETAVKGNYVPGMVCLGYLNRAGLLGENRQQEAFHWYEKAARLGSPIAMYSLGTMYALGEGTKQDFQRAYIWLLLAAKCRVAIAVPLVNALESKFQPKEVQKLKEKALQEKSRTIVHDNRVRIPSSNSA